MLFSCDFIIFTTNAKKKLRKKSKQKQKNNKQEKNTKKNKKQTNKKKKSRYCQFIAYEICLEIILKIQSCKFIYLPKMVLASKWTLPASLLIIQVG